MEGQTLICVLPNFRNVPNERFALTRAMEELSQVKRFNVIRNIDGQHELFAQINLGDIDPQIAPKVIEHTIWRVKHRALTALERVHVAVVSN